MTPRAAQWWQAIDLNGAPTTGPVAFCADLDPDTLFAAYQIGLFPMPIGSEYGQYLFEAKYEGDVAAGRIAVPNGNPAHYRVAWWSPDPRPVLRPGDVRISRRLGQRLRHQLTWSTTADRAFPEVVNLCATGREPGWLGSELRQSLIELHHRGQAHSVEVWDEERLIAGVFGVRAGPGLSLDSMFHTLPDSGRVAVMDMAARFLLEPPNFLDLQWDVPHARSLGAHLASRASYLQRLRGTNPSPSHFRCTLPVHRLAL